MHRARHDRDVRSASPRCGRQGEPHPARGPIADEPHGIDRLARRAGRDEHFFTPQRRRLRQHPADLFDDLVRLQHPPRAVAFTGCQRAGSGPRHTIRQRVLEVSEVGLYLGMGVHPVVHGRTDEHGGPRRQQRGREQVVCTTLSRPSNQIGSGGRHTHDVGLGPELDVESGPLSGKQVGRGRAARDPLERERLDETLRAGRNNRVDDGAEPGQVSGELNGFIGGDAPGNAEDDPPSLPRPPGMKYTWGRHTRFYPSRRLRATRRNSI